MDDKGIRDKKIYRKKENLYTIDKNKKKLLYLLVLSFILL